MAKLLTARCAIISLIMTSSGAQLTPPYNWTWLGGSSQINSYGIYTGASRQPGSRQGHVTVMDDLNDRILMFGGYGYAMAGVDGLLNDLWMFDAKRNSWAFIGGQSVINSVGVYSGTFWPGGRWNHTAVWHPSSQSMVIFGGYGITTNTASPGYLNDVWQWQWNSVNNNGTWVIIFGSTTTNSLSVYSGVVVPGARSKHQMLVDSISNSIFYIYGGYGYSDTDIGYLTDLWAFNISLKSWSFFVGNGLNVAGNYLPASYQPGGRMSMSAALDSANRLLYVFGGFGLSEISTTSPIFGILNDLWRFNLTSRKWTFLGGSQQQENAGSISSQPFWPSSRRDAQIVYDDFKKRLFLIGGFGFGRPSDNPAASDTAFISSMVDPNNNGFSIGSICQFLCGDVSWARDGLGSTYWNPNPGPTVYSLNVVLEPTAPVPITRIRFFPSGDGVHSPTGVKIWTSSNKLVQLLSITTSITTDTTYTLSSPYYGRTFYLEIGKTTTWQIYIHEIQFLTNQFKGPLLDSWQYDPVSGNWSVLDANNNINRTGSYNASTATPGGRSTYSIVLDKLRRRLIMQGGRGFGSSNSVQGSYNEMWAFSIDCSMAGYYIWNGACLPCPIGTYCPGDDSIRTCGQNSNTTTIGSNLVSQCICNSGYYGVNGSCTICPIGSFCSGGFATQCSNNANTTQEGSFASNQCLCKPGYYGISSNCTICPLGSYCPGGMSAVACSSKSNTVSQGTTSISQCICNTGFYGNNGNCIVCPENSQCTSTSFKCQAGYEISSDQTRCTACISPNKYKPADGNTMCITCPANAICTQTDFQCNAGYFTSVSEPAQCSPCPPGTSKPMAGNSGPIACQPCLRGMYQPQSAQLNCLVCPENSTCTTTGTIMFTCNAGYRISIDQLSCEIPGTPTSNPKTAGSSNFWVTLWQTNIALGIVIISSFWLFLMVLGFVAGYLLFHKNHNRARNAMNESQVGQSSMTVPATAEERSRYYNTRTRPRSHVTIRNQPSLYTTERRSRPVSIAVATLRANHHER